jgi:hypothetical protein
MDWLQDIFLGGFFQPINSIKRPKIETSWKSIWKKGNSKDGSYLKTSIFLSLMEPKKET